MQARRSLSARLLLGAGVFITAAIVIAGIVIFFALHRFVQGQIDQRLDTQIVFLTSMLQVGPDGTLTLSGTADGPPFDRKHAGWYWEVAGPKTLLKSQSLNGLELAVPDLSGRPVPPPLPPPPGHEPPPPPGTRPQPADQPGPDGQALHYRILSRRLDDVPVTIVATAPRAAVLGPLREAMTTLAASLAILAVALVLAMVLQVKLGLRPLARLRNSVSDVRAGRVHLLPDDQPREIEPLVIELNSLLNENQVNLERARRHVANLAHGLKTPLATLAIALPNDARANELHALVETMDRRIRHHLGRARTAALSGPVRAQALLQPRIRDLVDVLGKINSDKNIAFICDVPSELSVACEPQDLDEMLGNLLENAFRWAESIIHVSAHENTAGKLAIAIEDDGPGVQQEELPRILQAGKRLDEQTAGFGFGLPITRELAELYGGDVAVDHSKLGGLRVVLVLPLPNLPPSDRCL